MPNSINALILSAIIVLGLLAVCMLFRHVGRKRTFARLIAFACPACGRPFGLGILATTKEAGYFWNPAPGHSVTSLRLPNSTFVVTCPHCSTETEFKPNGCVFEPPKEGVLSFTRFICTFSNSRTDPAEQP
jgi:hypothetical protein